MVGRENVDGSITIRSANVLAEYIEQIATAARIDELNRHKAFGLGDRLRKRITQLRSDSSKGLVFIGEDEKPKTVRVLLVTGKSVLDPCFIQDDKDFSGTKQFMAREPEQ